MENAIIMDHLEEQPAAIRDNGPDRKATVLKLVDTFAGQGDVSEWLEKIHTVCMLNGVIDEADMLYVVTLRVTGEAYQVLQQMLPEERASLAAVKNKLKEAYEVNMFDAYELMRTRMWRTGESVDGYASAVARLAELSGGASPRLLVAAFVSGLPKQARDVIRSTTRPGEVQWSDVVGQARRIINKMMVDNAERCLVMNDQGRDKKESPPGQERRREPWCRKCKIKGHWYSACPDVTCFTCQKRGHVMRKCPGNGVAEQA